MCGEVGSLWGVSTSYAQFRCEADSVLKNKLYLERKETLCPSVESPDPSVPLALDKSKSTFCLYRLCLFQQFHTQLS